MDLPLVVIGVYIHADVHSYRTKCHNGTPPERDTHTICCPQRQGSFFIALSASSGACVVTRVYPKTFFLVSQEPKVLSVQESVLYCHSI